MAHFLAYVITNSSNLEYAYDILNVFMEPGDDDDNELIPSEFHELDREYLTNLLYEYENSGEDIYSQNNNVKIERIEDFFLSNSDEPVGFKPFTDIYTDFKEFLNSRFGYVEKNGRFGRVIYPQIQFDYAVLGGRFDGVIPDNHQKISDLFRDNCRIVLPKVIVLPDGTWQEGDKSISKEGLTGKQKIEDWEREVHQYLLKFQDYWITAFDLHE
jgi:hypothetical protein